MRIPGFSFWALVTAGAVYMLLKAVGVEPSTALIFAVIWYVIGVGASIAVYGYHHPRYELDYSAAMAGGAMGAPAGMFAVTFANQGRTVFVPAGGNLRSAAQEQGVEVYYDITKYANCRGLGFCGTCRFSADATASNAFSEPTWQEKFTLGDTVGKVRLACQTAVFGNAIIDNTVAQEIGEVHHYAVINGVMFGAFSLIMLAMVIWIGGDMIGVF